MVICEISYVYGPFLNSFIHQAYVNQISSLQRQVQLTLFVNYVKILLRDEVVSIHRNILIYNE